ncbi:hypothetical protein [Candidatus Phytoplasma sp. AldY-WA1]|uniref:hypothetical protein n=1 Tax=Candidatus Phytoplasma sp. AldY-WA1 TaxID=2852100 RepID=UPI00254E2272|nr:hypothetical protein [Candidatus Phytoplasma sp. AldY-WA1]
MSIHHLSTTIILILVTIILLINPFHFINAKLQNSFHQQTTYSIKTYSTQQLKDKWVSTQQPLKRYDFNIYNKNDIIKILKDNNSNCDFSSSFDSNKPGYNCYDSQSLGTYWFKDPPSGLITVYFKYRDNPFNQKYPVAHYKHTLDDLLKHEISISEAYIFWDVNPTIRSQRAINLWRDITYSANRRSRELIQKVGVFTKREY